MTNLYQTGFSRVFLSPDGGGTPRAIYTYGGLVKAGAPTRNYGDVTKVEIPDPTRYDEFIVADTIKGSVELPTLPLMARTTKTASAFFDRAERGCEFDVQIHVGSCSAANDFNGGWADGHIKVWENAKITSWGLDGDMSAISSDERATPMEQFPITARRMYQIRPLVPELQAAALITDELLDVAICDAVSCGACGLPSSGCQVFFGLQAESSGSPGAGAKVVYTSDGGSAYATSIITAFSIADVANRMTCVGTYLVVTSADHGGIAYVPIANLTAGTGLWTSVTTGFNGSGAPNAIFSVGSDATWIAGAGGYIYKSIDITAGVTTQADGTATSEDLNDIHGADDEILVAVGDNNALLVTTNGGDTWQLVTGPAVGVDLNTVFVKDAYTWVVGDAAGSLWYTVDGGTTWTEKSFTGSGAGAVQHVTFVSNNVGYLAHQDASTRGHLLRTIDGGASWYRLPEAAGLNFPTVDRVNRVAACEQVNENVVIAGGLADDASDGFLIKAA